MFLEIHYYHTSLSLKFHKDPSFRYGDIYKMIMYFRNFQCIFHILPIMHLKSLQIWIITDWLGYFWEYIDIKMSF